MAETSEALPGYTELPEGANEYSRILTVQAKRITGPFLVRGQNSLSHINDGWLIKGSDGYLFGVEDVDFATRFALVTAAITASAGANGAIDPVGVVAVDTGEDQVFTVTPDVGFELDELLVDGEAAVLTDGEYTFAAVSEPHTIAVTFAAITNTITATAGANGTIDPVGAVVVAYAANQVFTVTTEYELDTLLVDGQAAVLTGGTYTFTNVVAAHTIAATFTSE